MENTKNEKNGLIQSQKLLYEKLIKINHLFKIHVSSLILMIFSAVTFIIIWIQLLLTGQIIMALSERYGLFGTIVTIIIITVLIIIIIQLGMQIYLYSSFIIKGNHSLKQAKGIEETRTALYKGIVPYISYFFKFFNRYSKEKTNLSKIVRTFLFFNFFSGFWGVFLITRLLNAEITNSFLLTCMTIFLLSMLVFWLINLSTSIKIKNEVIKWENLFPRLEEWAQELEKISSENSKYGE